MLTKFKFFERSECVYMKDIKILIAAHKSYVFPNDSIYLPIHVGAIDKPSIGVLEKDDTGINISSKNYSFCELTGLYWGWKNLEYEYLGLVHYRRHFCSKKFHLRKYNKIIKGNELNEILKHVDIILPKKRKYYIETNESQYLHAHHEEGLYTMYDVLSKMYPEYVDDLKSVMNKRSGHRFNMLIMKKSLVDEYCTWLFSILFEVEKRLDITTWDKSEQRVYGYLAERLLDVWLYHNKYEYKELNYVFTERQNWFKKIYNFVARKFKAGNK